MNWIDTIWTVYTGGFAFSAGMCVGAMLALNKAHGVLFAWLAFCLAMIPVMWLVEPPL